MGLKGKNFFLFLIIVIIRIATVFFIWRNILIAFLINLVMDSIDGDVLARRGMKRRIYQKYDKLLDYWFYIFLFIYQVTQLPRNYFWYLLLTTFLFRSLGVILFTLSRKEWLLFVFPGFYHYLFLLYILFPKLFIPLSFKTCFFFFFFLIFTYWREWKLHVEKIDMTNFFLPFIKPKKW